MVPAAPFDGATDQTNVDIVAAVLVLRRDGAALLQHRDDKPGIRQAGKWGLPGGRAESGESIVECARRELREETEYDAADLELLTIFDRTDEFGVAFRVTYFWCWYDEVQPITCHEGQAMAFIERSKASNYPIPAFLFKIWDAAFAVAGRTITKAHT